MSDDKKILKELKEKLEASGKIEGSPIFILPDGLYVCGMSKREIASVLNTIDSPLKRRDYND